MGVAVETTQPDRLTIAKLLLLTVGAAVGMSCFSPPSSSFNWTLPYSWLRLLSGILCGLSLPGMLFVIRLRLQGGRLGPGALFTFMSGLASLFFLPTILIAGGGIDEGSRFARPCLNYVMPLVGLWFLVAAILGRATRPKVWLKAASWTERFGYLLAVGWSLHGIWILYFIFSSIRP